MHVYTLEGGYTEIAKVGDDRDVVPVLRYVFTEVEGGDTGFQGDEIELARLLCFLLDALAIRDDEGLAPADWVEIGSDDEDEPDLYAEAYDEGFRDAQEGATIHVKSYEEGYRDGSAAAFEMAAEDAEDDEYDGDDHDVSCLCCGCDPYAD